MGGLVSSVLAAIENAFTEFVVSILDIFIFLVVIFGLALIGRLFGYLVVLLYRACATSKTRLKTGGPTYQKLSNILPP
ncbi:E protein [Hedgehog arterivirus]|nr:E protein [Hedgehog arterivirus]